MQDHPLRPLVHAGSSDSDFKILAESSPCSCAVHPCSDSFVFNAGVLGFSYLNGIDRDLAQGQQAQVHGKTRQVCDKTSF